MKRITYFVVALLLVAALLLVNAPKSVSASAGDTGSGSWVLPNTYAPYTTINVEADAKTAPNWLQLLSEGITITKADKICYPFRGGQFHWVPQIMQLTDGKWTNIDTTKEYLNNDDGMLYYACSAAPAAAGTYALFGYYNGPVEVTGQKECAFTFVGQYKDYGDMNTDWVNQTFNLLFYFHNSIIKNGDPVTYSIYNVTPTGSITSGLTGTTTVALNAAHFSNTVYYNTSGEVLPGFNVYLDFPRERCYKIVYIQMLYHYGSGG